MKHISVENFAKRMEELEPRLSTFCEGGYITGTFRGKRGYDYKYCFTSGEMIFDNNGYATDVVNNLKN